MRKTRNTTTDLDRALLYSAMIEQGILPIDNPALDMRVPLRRLSPQDARARKRKFRKAWRRIARESDVQGKRMGMGKLSPSRAEKLFRKEIVLERTRVLVVEPTMASLTLPRDKT